MGRLLIANVLGVEDPTLSRDHCQIRWRGRNYWIRDGSEAGFPSLGGTYLNGQRLSANHWELLPAEADLRAGQSVLRLRHQANPASQFDLMVSYSRKDEAAVMDIFAKMRGLGLNPWMDQTGNRPAANYLQDIEKILDESSAAIVFWGGDHMGNTQAAEVGVIKARHIQRQIRWLFLVVLPGSMDPDFGALLTTIDYYDLRKPGEIERLLRNLEKALLPGEPCGPT